MKTLILYLLSAIAIFGVSIYLLSSLLFRRRWFDLPDSCGNVGGEEE